MTDATNEILNKLKSKGCRITKARKLIVDTLAAAGHSVTIKDITDQVRADEASVYRNIKLLKEVGVVEEILIKGDRPHYALADGHHHHLVCRGCGKISHVPCHNEINKPKLDDGFAVVDDHDLTFYGLCVKCG